MANFTREHNCVYQALIFELANRIRRWATWVIRQDCQANTICTRLYQQITPTCLVFIRAVKDTTVIDNHSAHGL